MAHHHTSYAALVFLLMLAGVVAAGASYSSLADSSLLSLTVNGPAPTVAATIDDPVTGTHFPTNTVTVRGTCPAGVGIELYRNGTFAGSTLCDVNGLYAVLITLVPGRNDLIARDVDALQQYGPDSATVTVYYDAPTPTPTPTPTPSPAASPTPTPAPAAPGPSATPKTSGSPAPAPQPGPAPLVISSDRHFYQATSVGTAVDWTVNISGGVTPYTITWDWGDGTTSHLAAGDAGPVKQEHSYSQPGTYQLTIRAHDASGHDAVMQLVVIVNGSGATGGLNRHYTDLPGNLILIWPLLALAGLAVLCFWLGERHELSIFRPQLSA